MDILIATECVRGLDKLILVKRGSGGSLLGAQLPQKMTLASKVVKSDSKIIISFR